MAVAQKDNNNVSTMLGVLNTDGTTPTSVKASPSSHTVVIHNNGSGSDVGNDNAVKDDNSVSTLIATSESDGSTPVTLFVDSSGRLLVDSN